MHHAEDLLKRTLSCMMYMRSCLTHCEADEDATSQRKGHVDMQHDDYVESIVATADNAQATLLKVVNNEHCGF